MYEFTARHVNVTIASFQLRYKGLDKGKARVSQTGVNHVTYN